MRLPLLLILAIFLLAACGQSEPPAKGEAGAPAARGCTRRAWVPPPLALPRRTCASGPCPPSPPARGAPPFSAAPPGRCAPLVCAPPPLPGLRPRLVAPPGPATFSGPNGPAIKVFARPCDQPTCGASCEENEQILNAYALNPGGAISFIDERNATFRPQKRPAVLVLVCVGK